MRLPKQTILRLFQYREFLILAKSIGIKNVYSDTLAEALGSTSTQVRKDFSLFGITGNKRAGYKLDSLLQQLDELLGKNKKQKVVVVGAGNLGMALMHYEGFKKEGIEIVALFDNNAAKCDPEHAPPILPIEQLYDFVEKNQIKLGVIAVPYHAAQQILDLMILAGIKGVLNFAPIYLKAPKDLFINDINLRLELETVGYFIKSQNKLNPRKGGS
jgi:redox-sensing transcriptional repressor